MLARYLRHSCLWPLLLLSAGAQASDVLTLKHSELERLGVVGEAAETASVITLRGLPGQVELSLGSSMAVTAPFAGRVLQVLVDEGEMVEKAATLAILSSKDYGTARAELLQQRVTTDLARKQARRDAELVAEGIVPISRAEASRAAQASAEAQLAGLEASLSGLQPHNNDGTGYRLTAPERGVVVTREISTSAAVEALSVAFVLARDTRWRLTTRAPLGLMSVLDKDARLSTGAMEAPVSGRGLRVDEATQTVTVRATLPEHSGLAPGQRLALTLTAPAPAGALRVARAAIVHSADASSVYVMTPLPEGARVHAVAVKVLAEDAEHSVIEGDVEAGQQVVIRGTSALKALGGD